MPAREMHFTFDTKVKVNKKTVLQFVTEFEDYIRKDFQEIKTQFDVKAIDADFLKKFIKELKEFDSVSVKDRDVHGRQRIVKSFIYRILGDEIKEPQTVLGIKYLYDEWEYEGCGSNDHYYLTYTNVKKMVKKYTKETEVVVNKLRQMGLKVEFKIIE